MIIPLDVRLVHETRPFQEIGTDTGTDNLLLAIEKDLRGWVLVGD